MVLPNVVLRMRLRCDVESQPPFRPFFSDGPFPLPFHYPPLLVQLVLFPPPLLHPVCFVLVKCEP